MLPEPNAALGDAANDVGVAAVQIGVPGPPTGLALAPASDTGRIGDTATAHPVPIVTGEADPGIRILLQEGTQTLGATYADARGTWSVSLPGLAEGLHVLLAIADDGAEQTPASTPFTLTIDRSVFGAVSGLHPASDTGVAGDNITLDASPIICGTGEPGSTIVLREPGTSNTLGTAIVALDGSWAVATSPLPPGFHDLVADLTDLAGNSLTTSTYTLGIAELRVIEAARPVVLVGHDGVTDSREVLDYDGPVAYLDYTFLGSNQPEAVIATSYNDFVNLSGGDDAAAGGAGDDVLDGGTGSNFLSGGDGRDVFFVDGRDGAPTWSTIADWQSGEQLSLFGWRPGVSSATWVDTAGTPGYRGVTLHADLDGDGTLDTSITWSGCTRDDVPTPLTLEGLSWFT